jgi:hypothetical protein
MRCNVFILIITLFFWGCNSNDPQKMDGNTEVIENNLPTYLEIVWKDPGEVLFLLSNKYKIDSSIVKPLITEYLRIHDPWTYMSLTDHSEQYENIFDYVLKPKEDVNTTVIRLSQLYTIDVSTLSSFIYDFRVYQKLLKIEERISSN